MENTKQPNRPEEPQNNTSPIENVADNQQTTYGAKRDKQTNGYDIENQPGYHNQYQSGVDDAPVQAQQSSGGMNQIGQEDDKSYNPAKEERSNVQEANDDVMTKGHVVTSELDEEGNSDTATKQSEKVGADVANDGTTTEGR